MANLLKKAVNFIKYYSFFDRREYLLIKKGKYIIQNREDMDIDDTTVQIENNVQASDEMWSNDSLVSNYLCPPRIIFYKKVIDIIEKMKLSSSSKIIDVGCGIGYFANMVEKNMPNCKCYAYDFSREALNYIKLNYSRLILKQGSIHNIEYPDNTFDLVMCMEVLEHIQYAEKAIGELKRICKDDGCILITIPNGPVDRYLGHTNFWDEETFKQILYAQNLQLINTYSIDRDLEKNYFMVFVLKK